MHGIISTCMHWTGLKTLIQALILMPLLSVGGVFNPAATLPPWAQQLSPANPMFYLVNAFRWSFLSRSIEC